MSHVKMVDAELKTDEIEVIIAAKNEAIMSP